jgi:hypothetical protein
MQKMLDEIPTYAADGSRLRNRRLAKVLDLESRKQVVLRRNGKGKVQSAHFCEKSRSPVQAQWKAGTRYSYEKKSRWTLAPLPRMPVSPGQCPSERAEELDRERRKAFQAVPLSIVRQPARVISIAAGKRAEREAKRPARLSGTRQAA